MKYLYRDSLWFVAATMLIPSSIWAASDENLSSRARQVGDERKFEATHFLRPKSAVPESKKIYLRSGTVIGAREFYDPSTFNFELATGSRFGHVGILISMADLLLVRKRAIDSVTADRHVPGATPYIEWINRKGWPWTRVLQHGEDRGQEYLFKPTCKMVVRNGARVSHPESTEWVDPLTWMNEHDGLLMGVCDLIRPLPTGLADTKFMNDIETHLQEGDGEMYRRSFLRWESDMRAANQPIPMLLDQAILIDMSPPEDRDYPRNTPGIKMDTSRGVNEFRTHSDPGPFMSAIRDGTFSLIEPKEDLSIEEIEKILWYAFYLRAALADYNYGQSEAGIFCQNCSEFVCHAFEEAGIAVGQRQRMDSLNINTLGGGLRVGMKLRGVYRPERIVITPKSVMQSAVSHSAQSDQPSQSSQLRHGLMRVVPEFDHLDVAATVSDRELWQEWEQAGKLHWTFRPLRVLLGDLGQPLSDQPFEEHSAEGLHKRVDARWTNAQLAAGAAVLIAAGAVAHHYRAQIAEHVTRRLGKS